MNKADILKSIEELPDDITKDLFYYIEYLKDISCKKT